MGNWGLVEQRTASDGAASDYFGYSVSISEDFVIVGAHADDLGVNVDQGSAHVYAAHEPVADSQSVTLNEDGTLTITVTGSDAGDPDVGMVSFEVSSSVTHGILSAIGSVTRTSPGHYSQQF